MGLEQVRGHAGASHGVVFINYRAADQPMAAAAIHDGLARRIGAERVFRDCASMRAGEHYPTAIRAALENAAVLVAVIGPRWLTLTGGRPPTRLLDREHDWVRVEIASALRLGIPIIPIRLVGGPEGTPWPAADDLPEDIRPLAMLQAFELSQRSLGLDLDRLARLLLAPALALPSPYAEPSPAPRRLDPANPFDELLEAFVQLPLVQQDSSRMLLLSLVRAEIAGVVPYHPSYRLHMIAALRTCLQYDGGLIELVDAAATLGTDRGRLQQLRTLADQFRDQSSGI
jgi:hypothetical protein